MQTRMRRTPSLCFFLLTCTTASLAQTGGVTGSGLYVAPSTASFANLNEIAWQIKEETKAASVERVITYDAQIFGAMALYRGAANQMKDWYLRLAPRQPLQTPQTEFNLFGLSLAPVSGSDVAALIQLFVPQYAIQGQALKLENDALISAFAEAAGDRFTVSSYLTPKPVLYPDMLMDCPSKDSFAQGWTCAEVAALKLTADRRRYQDGLANPAAFANPALGCTGSTATADIDRCKKGIQGEIDKFSANLDAYQKVKESYLTADRRRPCSAGSWSPNI